MSKRFTDTDKWERPWFRKLPAAYKLLWSYLTDKCDLAGVWYVDFEMASFVIGEKLDPETAINHFQKQIQVLDPSRWLITDFVHFQYGELKENNNLHRSVASRLRALDSAPQQPLNSPSVGAKEKERVKEKDGSKSLGGVGGATPFWSETLDFMSKAYPDKKHVAFFWRPRYFKALKSLISLYQPEGVMSLWETYLALDDTYAKNAGYSFEMFETKIPRLVDDPAWKGRARVHAERIYSKPPADLSVVLNTLVPDKSLIKKVGA